MPVTIILMDRIPTGIAALDDALNGGLLVDGITLFLEDASEDSMTTCSLLEGYLQLNKQVYTASHTEIFNPKLFDELPPATQIIAAPTPISHMNKSDVSGAMETGQIIKTMADSAGVTIPSVIYGYGLTSTKAWLADTPVPHKWGKDNETTVLLHSHEKAGVEWLINFDVLYNAGNTTTTDVWATIPCCSL